MAESVQPMALDHVLPCCSKSRMWGAGRAVKLCEPRAQFDNWLSLPAANIIFVAQIFGDHLPVPACSQQCFCDHLSRSELLLPRSCLPGRCHSEHCPGGASVACALWCKHAASCLLLWSTLHIKSEALCSCLSACFTQN